MRWVLNISLRIIRGFFFSRFISAREAALLALGMAASMPPFHLKNKTAQENIEDLIGRIPKKAWQPLADNQRPPAELVV